MIFSRLSLIRGLAITLALVTAATTLSQAEQALPPNLPANARVAIIGDSITEQKLYSLYIECYLLACTGRTDIKTFQFGWSGETAGGFAQRMQNDLSVFNPNVATFCYGMNDGRYIPYNDTVGGEYEKNMRLIVGQAPGLGLSKLVIGSPGAVDTKYFRAIAPQVYNDNLAHLRDIDKKLAAEGQHTFANVHDAMIDAMAKGKAALGEDYDVCGRDGVHPLQNGHLIMAGTFLRALGCDGNIGDITVDMKGKGTTAGGHKITQGEGGSLEVESTVWPFCFDFDPKASWSTRSILPFCNFNQDLNRFTLHVKNLDAPKAKVTWNGAIVEFTREQLAKGINLAAEFPYTPFDEPFRKFAGVVLAKQSYETVLVKGMVTNFRYVAGDAAADPEFAAALGVLKKKMMSKHEGLDAEARKAFVPVKHWISVEAVQ